MSSRIRDLMFLGLVRGLYLLYDVPWFVCGCDFPIFQSVAQCVGSDQVTLIVSFGSVSGSILVRI